MMNKEECRVKCDYALNKIIREAKEEIRGIIENSEQEIRESITGDRYPQMIVYTAITKIIQKTGPRRIEDNPPRLRL
jgi:hypothetical protein